MTAAVCVSHVLNGTVNNGGWWTSSCACGWRSERCRLPGQTYIRFLSHRIEPEAVA